MSMVNKNTFFLRKATRADLNLLFAWANDPEVRRNSCSTAMISHEEHVARFDRLMKNPNSTQYILTVKGRDAGQIRITIDGERAEIDYSIAPKYRCMGYGKMIISLLPKAVKEDFPKVKTLAAQVKADNIASRKAFMDNHYQEKNLVYELDIDMANEDKKAADIHVDAGKSVRGGGNLLN